MITIKAIGFDWGGVLNGQPARYFDMAVAEAIGVSVAEYKAAYFKHNYKANVGEWSWRELWQAVIAELGYEGNAQILTRIEQVIRDKNQADGLNEEVFLLVERLRANGYAVGVLSNNSVDKAALMRQIGLERQFDVLHVSAETGLVKPEPAAFMALAESLGVAIEELAFVDDTPKSLSTAEETGFVPILFDGHEGLVEDLRRLGVRVD